MRKLMKDLSPGLNSNKYLVCVPYAGGYSNSFLPLKNYLPKDIKLISFDPPGHGPNLSPLVDNIDDLVSLYLMEMQPILEGEVTLFGHSMGGIIVHRMAQILESKGINPKNVIISAMNPPEIRRKTNHLDDKDFIDYIKSLGGLPDEVLQHQELLNYILPVIRSDFRAIENYINDDTTLLKAPLYIISGTTDSNYTVKGAKKWVEWGNEVHFLTVNGGHMFLLHQADIVGGLIMKILDRVKSVK
ncbi:thioesterase II family protein [Bacillus cereus]|uniref:thioesterase II family protein n=1 Tax=Bacillus cereus TaxID=1396 RepID=UPI00211D3C7B|nr:alpha/beta fold hydrolase [Bacillus cereus]